MTYKNVKPIKHTGMKRINSYHTPRSIYVHLKFSMLQKLPQMLTRAHCFGFSDPQNQILPPFFFYK